MTASIKAKLEALEAIKKELPEIAKRIKIYIDMIYTNETNRIDILSAVMTDIFDAYISDSIAKDPKESAYTFFEFSISRMWHEILDDGSSPRESVKSLFDWYKRQYESSDPEYAALEKLKKKFDAYALKNIPDYQYKTGITKETLFSKLFERYEFILENTPDVK